MAAPYQIFEIQIIVLVQQGLKIVILIPVFLFLIFLFWDILELLELVFVFILLLAFEAEVQGVPRLEISGAYRTHEDRFRLFYKAISALVTEHVGLFQKFFGVFRRTVLYRNFSSVELMQMLLVLFKTTLAEAEIVTGKTIKSEFATIYSFLAAIASKPGLKSSGRFLLLDFLLNLFFYGLGKLSFVLLLFGINLRLSFRSR